jgi:hypothetical protein
MRSDWRELVCLAVTVVAVTLLAFLLGAGVCHAQEESYSPLPGGAVAVTYCLGGRVRSVVDMAILGSDSAEEIAAHEAAHRATQLRRMRDLPQGTCAPMPDALLLTDEVHAYCTSLPYRSRRVGEGDARRSYLLRLVYQFRETSIPPDSVLHAWITGCPS